MSEKLSAKQYAEQLLYKPEYAADKQPDVKEKAAAFAEGYKNFLDHAKTEREAAATSEQMLLAAGYKPFEPKKTYAPGEKIYFIQEHKAVVAATIGQKPFEEGAEIVTGSLQDLDRAVLVGQRTFGKGLVQTTRPLGYNSFLKVTTAKYYIPSGRCIQAIDYSHSQEGSVRVIPDSLISEFSTKAGRKVYDGVHPDVIYVAPDPDAKVPTIKVDQIRSIAATAYILPSEAEKKVYVLRQADTMNLSAQNAFLKLLEEPPQSAAFILAVASPELLLPTVRSRCALLRDPTEQLQESDEIRTLAEDYLRAVASQDRLTLLRWCLAQEGMDAQTLSAFLPAVQHWLVQLLAEPDETVLPQALCAQQLRLMETCENYRRANVGTKHIFGLLSVSGVQAKVQK